MPTRLKSGTRQIILFAAALLIIGGCSSGQGTLSPYTQASGPSGLIVRTHDEGRLFFHDEQWRLTMQGISGRAEVTTADGEHYSADTTLSYWSAEAAESSGRSNTMGRFMLTVLGVILVLGLAGIILYAAFLATDR